MKLTIRLISQPLKPQRVLIISKLSAWEFMKARDPYQSEEHLVKRIMEAGKDPFEIINEHRLQLACEKKLVQVLKKLDISFQIMKKTISIRVGNACKCVDWSDLVIPIGGDGTFLLASKLVRDNVTPVMGINPTDDSTGQLTLSPQRSADIEKIFEMLYAGEYSVLMRSRIRTTMEGEGLYRQPFHVHEKSRMQGERRIDALVRSTQRKMADALQPRHRILPWLALNEVFMGEFLAARSISLKIQVDDEQEHKIRSSGICVCTGSGSNSWYKSMNVQPPSTIRALVELATGKQLNEEEINELVKKYHRSLIFDPEEERMTYMIREMYWASRCDTDECLPQRKMCRKIKVMSYGFDAGLVLDGSVSLPFNDGTKAMLEIRPEFALRNIVLN